MRVRIVIPPLHPPTAPALGPCALKAAVEARFGPGTAEVRDWNLEFFRSWVRGGAAHLCQASPHLLVGRPCPNVLAEAAGGPRLWDDLRKPTRDEQDAARYMRAVQDLDAVQSALAGLLQAALVPWIEGREAGQERAAEELLSGPVETLCADRPDLLGFSVLAEGDLLAAVAAARFVKERYGIPVAMGGAMMSHMDPAEILAAFPWIDWIFRGEAEESLPLFLERGGVSDAASCPGADIPGLAHAGADGPCVHPPAGPADLSALARPDFSDLPLDSYLAPAPVLPLLAGRGCYWGRCAFCSHVLPYAPGVRLRDPASVVDEMAAHLERYGARHFLFVDEALAPAVLDRIVSGILERGLDVRWGAEGIRAEAAWTEERLGRAREAGLRWIYVGVESTRPRLLERIRKGTGPDQIRSLVRTCRRVGVVPQLSFILGIPGTTAEELDAELDFLEEEPVDASPFALLLGSPMALEPEAYGVRVEAREVLYHTVRGPVHAPRFRFTVEQGLSVQEVERRTLAREHRFRRMRPHLGEVHAVLLADGPFFDSEERPPPRPPLPARALARLDAGAGTPEADLHRAACLEALGRLDQAARLVERGRWRHAEQTWSLAIRLHRAVLANQSGRCELVPPLVRGVDLDDPAHAALRAELGRSLLLTGRTDQALPHLEAAAASWYEPLWLYPLLGRAYELAGRPEQALRAYAAAEHRFWYDPEINRARARCYRRLGKHRRARREEALARRKAGSHDAARPGPPTP